MRKFLVIGGVVGLLILIGGAFVASAAMRSDVASAQENTATTSAQDTTSDTTRQATDVRGRSQGVLRAVLSDLVADGVITQAQADAIAEAVVTRMAESRDAASGGQRGAFRRGFSRGLLEDGVITSEEIAGLPDGNPLKDPAGPAATYLEDGQITEDEFKALIEELRGLDVQGRAEGAEGTGS